MTTNRNDRTVAESLGFLMIWDGVLVTLLPVDHCLAFRRGPRWWRETIDWFAARPEVTRSVAIAELGGGLWLTLRGRSRTARRRAEPVS